MKSQCLYPSGLDGSGSPLDESFLMVVLDPSGSDRAGPDHEGWPTSSACSRSAELQHQIANPEPSGEGCHYLYGEFDPGSGRTLAACLTHASRTVNRASARGSVANGCVTRGQPAPDS